MLQTFMKINLDERNTSSKSVRANTRHSWWYGYLAQQKALRKSGASKSGHSVWNVHSKEGFTMCESIRSNVTYPIVKTHTGKRGTGMEGIVFNTVHCWWYGYIEERDARPEATFFNSFQSVREVNIHLCYTFRKCMEPNDLDSFEQCHLRQLRT
jgi:hypothetical protein